MIPLEEIVKTFDGSPYALAEVDDPVHGETLCIIRRADHSIVLQLRAGEGDDVITTIKRIPVFGPAIAPFFRMILAPMAEKKRPAPESEDLRLPVPGRRLAPA